jgi:hypothetical protein
MGRKRTKLFIVVACLILVFLTPYFIFAQELQLDTDYPQVGSADPEKIKGGLTEYVRYIFNFSIAIAALVFFFLLVRAGIIYLTSLGNPERMKKGKDYIISTLFGLFLLLASYLILTTINPQLVVFNLPIIEDFEPAETIPGYKWDDDSLSLITVELPTGQIAENGLWSEPIIKKTTDLIEENKDFLEEEITVNPTFERISDMNKYILEMTEECQCEELTALCTEPKDYRVEVGCAGDPCPEETRDQIEKALNINQQKINELLSFQEKIISQKKEFEEELSKFVDVEDEMIYCRQQSGSLLNISEHLSRLNFYYEKNWLVETKKLPGISSVSDDPLNFYCSLGGTVSDYSYQLLNPARGEIMLRNEFVDQFPREITTQESDTFSCPIEYPLGELMDELRELAIKLIVKMERLAELEGRMASKIDDMKDLTSRCNDDNCDINCDCVKNPCYEPGCGTPPGRQNNCYIGKCIPPSPYYPNPCYFFCNSPCLQAVGDCNGKCTRDSYEELSKKIKDILEQNREEEDMADVYQNLQDCPDACPRNEIMAKVIEIGKIEDEIFKFIKEINEIFPKINVLIGREEGAEINLKKIRESMNTCKSSGEIEDGGLGLVNCSSAIGSYGKNGEIIKDCNPRNYFCCLLAEIEPPKLEGYDTRMAYRAATKKYEPLPEIDGCPQGWLCEPEIKSYNQYKDASEPLKELLSCMREELDKTIEEKELEISIGVISVISDPKIYEKSCGWLAGPTFKGGCSHTYEIKYGKERVSAHYGGVDCRYMKKSFAVNFRDSENADYLIEAAKKCRPDSFIAFRTAQHYRDLHISLSGAEGCGTN